MAVLYDGRLTVVDHPLVQHKVAIMRDVNTSTKQFRELVRELALFEGYEATRDFPLEDVEVQTPLETCICKRVAGKKVAIVPILRAGLGMVDGLLELVPSARVGHVGMYRDPETHEPHEYYCKLPPDVESRTCLIVDPMLATGGSANAAIDYLRRAGVSDVRLLVLIAAPEGVEAVLEHDPDVRIFTASLDRQLNDHAYILPGLGDAGDRIFGTK
jgi:uracil phosphoribosyltransferase